MSSSPSGIGIPSPSVPALSIVIPTYNEAGRIADCLRQTLDFAIADAEPIEIILADDGSTDRTIAIAREIGAERYAIRILSLPHRGKAAAVRSGVEAATGSVVLFTDADLATPIHYATDLLARIRQGHQVAIASREGVGARRVGEPWYRHAMGRVFNSLIRLTLLPGLQDTQCGFKAFDRHSLGCILDRAGLYRDSVETDQARVTAFDVEWLYVARLLGYRIAVVPVVWSAGTGSKVNPITDTLVNLGDILRIRLNAWRGAYR